MHLKQVVKSVILILSLFYSYSSAVLLPFPSTQPAVSTSYDSILLKTWQGIKKRNIDPYSVPLVHRPKSEMPDDAVSEGAGYGMIVALYCNDQIYFDKIWDAAESKMWSNEGACYDWRVDKDGTRIGTGAASDADQDIALALIFADQLVKKNAWTAHKSPNNVSYAERAQSLINSIWTNLVQDGIYLRPGSNWGGKDFVNPGYFAPAYYRVFDQFESTDHNWNGLIDECYLIISHSPGDSLGLIPDWIKPDGSFAGSSLGYNSYAEGKFLYKDAIRVYWRLATDYLWYGDDRAKAFLKKAMNFLKTPDKANFFQMDGSAVTDTFSLGNKVNRFRTEHSHLTVGMWATAAMGAGGPQAAEPYSDELLKFYDSGTDYWGHAVDSNNEDTLHNEMYFDQFLAWFGASLISGVFTNIWEDMKDPNPELKLEFKSEPQFSTIDINASMMPLSVKAVFNKLARWTIEITHDSSKVSTTFTGSGDTASAIWYGLTSDGKVMPQGYYTVTISARGLAISVKKTVWLGKAFDLKVGDNLLVDNFKDRDLKPYLGTQWCSYLDGTDHPGAGLSTVPVFRVEDYSDVPALRWQYHLDGGSKLGFDPYAALEWNCVTPQGNLDLNGLDTIIITAASTSPLGVSIQLITSDISDYNYFQDSLYLSSDMKEYKLALKDFKHRNGGGDTTKNLSKMTALRFQIQNKDGSENSIIIQSMLFSGNLGKLYSSPPDYIPMPVSVFKRIKKNMRPADCSYVISKAGVYFKVPQKFVGSMITISDISGRVIERFSIAGTAAAWNFPQSRKPGKGLFLATIKGTGGKVVLPLMITN